MTIKKRTNNEIQPVNSKKVDSINFTCNDNVTFFNYVFSLYLQYYRLKESPDKVYSNLKVSKMRQILILMF